MPYFTRPECPVARLQLALGEPSSSASRRSSPERYCASLACDAAMPVYVLAKLAYKACTLCTACTAYIGQRVYRTASNHNYYVLVRQSCSLLLFLFVCLFVCLFVRLFVCCCKFCLSASRCVS